MIIVKKRKIQNKHIQLFIPKNRNMSIARKEKSVTYFMISLEIERARILWRQFLHIHFICTWLDHEQIHLWVYSENILKIFRILKVK